MGPYGPIPRIELIWVLALRVPNLGRDRAGNASGDLVLDGKDIGQFAVVAICPQMMASRCLDELCGDANAIAGAPHAAFEDVAHTKLATHLADVHTRTLVCERAAARD